MHNKSAYEVEYPDGTTEQLRANKIAENMILQVDSEGNHYQVFTEITCHKRYDSKIAKVDGFIKYSNWHLNLKRNTHGYKLLL